MARIAQVHPKANDLQPMFARGIASVNASRRISEDFNNSGEGRRRSASQGQTAAEVETLETKTLAATWTLPCDEKRVVGGWEEPLPQRSTL
jgi:hypothetical protein